MVMGYLIDVEKMVKVNLFGGGFVVFGCVEDRGIFGFWCIDNMVIWWSFYGKGILFEGKGDYLVIYIFLNDVYVYVEWVGG